MSTHAGDIFIDAKLDDKQYKKGLSNLDKSTSKIGSKLGKALTVTAIATGIASLINKTATLGDTIDKTSQKLGMSNKAYQEWDFIMRRTGANIDSMTMAMKTLSSSVATSKDALAELGITQQEAMSMSQEELFSRVIEGLQGVENKTRRTYLASQLLGRGATELGAMLNLSAEDMDNLRNRVASLGGIMSDTAVKNSAEFKDALTDIRFAFRGIGNTIAEYLLPLLTSAVNNYIIPAIQAIANAIRSLFAMIGKIAGGIRKGTNAVKGMVGKSTQKNADKSTKALNNVGNATGGVGKKAKGAKKQVQALKRELLGFDQITKLTKQDTSTGTGGAGGTGGGGGIDWGDLSTATEDASTLSNLMDNLSKIKLPQALIDACAHLRDAMSSLFEVLKTAGLWAWENVLKPLGEWLVNSLLPPAIDAIASAIDVITNVLKILGAILEPLWEPVIKPLFKFLGEVAVQAVQNLSQNLNNLATFLSKVAEGLEPVRKVLSEVGQAWITLKEKAGSFTATAKLTLSDAFTTAWNKVKGVWNSLKSKTMTIGINFKNALSSKWNGLAKKVNNARNKYKFLKSILPQFPYLAQGGFVKKNTPQLAVIGDNKREGEIVSPESKLEAMARKVASESANTQVVSLLSAILDAVNGIDPNTYLDGEAIKNNTVRRINQHTRATGQLEIII